MSFFYKETAFASLGIVIALMANGCGQSKIAQCNQLAEAINKATPLVEGFEKQSARSNTIFVNSSNMNEIKSQAAQSVTIFTKFAGNWDNLNQEIKTLNLVDEKIALLQQRYVKAGDRLSQGLREMAQVMAVLSDLQPNREGLETLKRTLSDFNNASEKLMSVGYEGSQAIDELNRYCSGN